MHARKTGGVLPDMDDGWQDEDFLDGSSGKYRKLKERIAEKQPMVLLPRISKQECMSRLQLIVEMMQGLGADINQVGTTHDIYMGAQKVKHKREHLITAYTL